MNASSLGHSSPLCPTNIGIIISKDNAFHSYSEKILTLKNAEAAKKNRKSTNSVKYNFYISKENLGLDHNSLYIYILIFTVNLQFYTKTHHRTSYSSFI